MQDFDVQAMQQHVVDGVGESLKGQFQGLQDEVGTRAIQLYAMCTVACVFLDFAVFCMIISYFGGNLMEQKIALILLNVAFWYCFYKWAAFARTLKGKLPVAV